MCLSIMLFGGIQFMIVQLRYIHTQDGKHVNDTNLKINCSLSICQYTQDNFHHFRYQQTFLLAGSPHSIVKSSLPFCDKFSQRVNKRLCFTFSLFFPLLKDKNFSGQGKRSNTFGVITSAATTLLTARNWRHQVHKSPTFPLVLQNQAFLQSIYFVIISKV